MARIRSIKPEFWTSEQVADCSTTTRLLFLGLLTFCDDDGNHPASVKTLKMEIFPADDLTVDQIRQMVVELGQNGLIVEYVVENKQYWHVTGWHKHQKIEKPTFRHPKFADYSESARLPFADYSESARLRSRVESSREEKKEEETTTNSDELHTDEPEIEKTAAVEVFKKMKVSEAVKLYRESYNKVMESGQQVVILQQLCDKYTPEAITAAFNAARAAPASSLNWVVERLNKNGAKHETADEYWGIAT